MIVHTNREGESNTLLIQTLTYLNNHFSLISMWIGKFQIKHDSCWVTPKAKKYHLVLTGVPLNAYEKDGRKYHTGVDFLYGDAKDKKRFLESLKSDKRVRHFSLHGDQLFTLVEGSEFVTHAFDTSLFFTSPVITRDGYEFWELGSWEKKLLMQFYEQVKRIAPTKILKLKRETPQMFLQYHIPSLTEKQRQAFMLASSMGYYHYPRKISVKDLAKRTKVPRSTFLEHLRKAEGKLLNVMIGMIGKPSYTGKKTK